MTTPLDWSDVTKLQRRDGGEVLFAVVEGGASFVTSRRPDGKIDIFAIRSNGRFDYCEPPTDHPYDIIPRHEKPNLQLREGGWYRRRDGEVVGPVRRYKPNGTYPFWVNGIGYTETGNYWENQIDHRYDLIEEVPAPEPEVKRAELPMFDYDTHRKGDYINMLRDYILSQSAEISRLSRRIDVLEKK